MINWWAWLPLVVAGALANPSGVLERGGTAFVWLLAFLLGIELMQ